MDIDLDMIEYIPEKGSCKECLFGKKEGPSCVLLKDGKIRREVERKFGHLCISSRVGYFHNKKVLSPFTSRQREIARIL